MDVRTETASHAAARRELSAHADRDELVAWARAVPGVRAVALHHGEPGAQQGLAGVLVGRGPGAR